MNWQDLYRLAPEELLLAMLSPFELGILHLSRALRVTVSYSSVNGAGIFLPLGRNSLTLTTTLTFPPGASILPIGVMLPSLERSEGVEADDLTVRISAATPGINRGSRAMPSK